MRTALRLALVIIVLRVLVPDLFRSAEHFLLQLFSSGSHGLTAIEALNVRPQ